MMPSRLRLHPYYEDDDEVENEIRDLEEYLAAHRPERDDLREKTPAQGLSYADLEQLDALERTIAQVEQELDDLNRGRASAEADYWDAHAEDIVEARREYREFKHRNYDY